MVSWYFYNFYEDVYICDVNYTLQNDISDAIFQFNEFNANRTTKVFSFNLNQTVNSIYSGVDWVYSYSEQLIAFDFSVWTFWLFNSYFDTAFNYFFKTHWFLSNYSFKGVVFWSNLVDATVSNIIIGKLFNNNFLDNLYLNRHNNNILFKHFETMFINESINQQFSKNWFKPTWIILELTKSEAIINATCTLLNFYIILIFFFIFLCFYSSFFSSPSKEENLIDHDYMIANSTIESEEEISSLDDFLLLFIFICYIFGWYFYSHAIIMIGQDHDFSLLLCVLPFFYIIILFVPSLLLYDFGHCFLMYLKGVGATTIFSLELVYDYIAFLAFYIRILVQAVRLLLIMFTYASLHDLVMYDMVSQRWLYGNENIVRDFFNLKPTMQNVGYFFFTKVFMSVSYWIYELLHTFFVVTAQFVAFFAMVFWLFFFLYTFFVLEQHMEYFGHIRNERFKKYENILKKIEEFKKII